MSKLNMRKVFQVAGLAVVTGMSSAALQASEGENLFNQNCSVCHAGGGNSLNPAKTLSAEHMQANGYTDVESIKNLVTNGKAPMPPFKGRLSPEQIEAVSQYVLDKSNSGW